MAFVPLHRACFDLGTGAILDIETALGKGEVLHMDLGAPGLLSAEQEAEAESVLSGGMPPMCWRDAGHLFESFQLREDTDYFVDVSLPVSLKDAEEQACTHPAWPFEQRLSNVFKRDPARRWKEINDGGCVRTIVTGQLRLRSHAGVLNLGVQCGAPFMAEVACRKLKYFEEFKELLDSLAEKAAELLLSFDSPVSLSFDTTGDLARNEAALHFLMRHVMSKPRLPTAIEEIVAQPHVRLMERIELISIEEIVEADSGLIADGLDVSELAKGGPLARLFGGFTPRALPQRETYESNDTPENRYAKAFLEHCGLIARRLEASMFTRGRRASEREARAWALAIEETLQHGMWRDVGPLTQIPANSQTLLRKRGYKELFRFDLSLRMSLALAWQHGVDLVDGLSGDARPVNQIYEYWCFFALREILATMCSEVGGGNFLSVAKDGLQIELAKGRRSECRFQYAAPNGKKVMLSLFYNKRFNRAKIAQPEWSGSYTSSFDPDFSILAAPADDTSATHWLHFDAKYRLLHQEVEGMFDPSNNTGGDEAMTDVCADSYEVELSRVHKQEDLFKMHTYRDGILSTRGAYVLFPGDRVGGRTAEPKPNLFVRHPSALGGGTNHRIPSVGAFDLAPGGRAAQGKAIAELIAAVLEVAASGKKYSEEQAYFSTAP